MKNIINHYLIKMEFINGKEFNLITIFFYFLCFLFVFGLQWALTVVPLELVLSGTLSHSSMQGGCCFAHFVGFTFFDFIDFFVNFLDFFDFAIFFLFSSVILFFFNVNRFLTTWTNIIKLFKNVKQTFFT